MEMKSVVTTTFQMGKLCQDGHCVETSPRWSSISPTTIELNVPVLFCDCVLEDIIKHRRIRTRQTTITQDWLTVKTLDILLFTTSIGVSFLLFIIPSHKSK